MNEESFLLGLQDLLEDAPKCFSLKGNQPQMLQSIVKYLIFEQQNRRSLDYFSSLFLFYVKLFRVMKNQQKQHQKLMTKEIVWALHSEQKDTIYQECIEKFVQESGENNLDWPLLRKYCVVIWYDQLNEIKRAIETIAKAEYQKTRDPNLVVLWYILLGKKNVLALLYKQSKIDNAQKTYEFLMNNFSEPRWRKAANNNAMALL